MVVITAAEEETDWSEEVRLASNWEKGRASLAEHVTTY